MSIVEEIRAAMSRDNPLSAQEVSGMLAKLQPELVRCNARWEEIAIAGPRSANNGPLYRKLLISGSVDEIAKMQQEFDRLSIERDRMRAMQNSLSQLRNLALLREADEGLPDLQKLLVAAIEGAEAKQRELEASFDAVEQLYLGIAQARGQLNAAGITPRPEQCAAAATIDRLAVLSPLSRGQRTSMHRDASVHSGNIGIVRVGSGTEDASRGRAAEWQA
ncbi:hypothetical protein [Xanthomonas sp. CFBP 8445]|uniref:hypothetical protein n=1 Tax=Xanthomonas sp. CFBP 8445 TaxID=2971236 RepID=UPI0002E86E56|nr:hypothetical protein [Xanthomonas sp. CFBP 8445]UYC12848.1 hypothetical protein NUG21_03630 [Xanthomonas sp. CFBP 8445]